MKRLLGLASIPLLIGGASLAATVGLVACSSGSESSGGGGGQGGGATGGSGQGGAAQGGAGQGGTAQGGGGQGGAAGSGGAGAGAGGATGGSGSASDTGGYIDPSWGKAACPENTGGLPVGTKVGEFLKDFTLKRCDGTPFEIGEVCGAKAVWISAAHAW